MALRHLPNDGQGLFTCTCGVRAHGGLHSADGLVDVRVLGLVGVHGLTARLVEWRFGRGDGPGRVVIDADLDGAYRYFGLAAASDAHLNLAGALV